MSTHATKCIMCGNLAYSDCAENALGIDGTTLGNIERGIGMEFCTLECFKELQRKMADRLRVYERIIEPPA